MGTFRRELQRPRLDVVGQREGAYRRQRCCDCGAIRIAPTAAATQRAAEADNVVPLPPKAASPTESDTAAGTVCGEA
jgi:hypothetical protein